MDMNHDEPNEPEDKLISIDDPLFDPDVPPIGEEYPNKAIKKKPDKPKPWVDPKVFD